MKRNSAHNRLDGVSSLICSSQKPIVFLELHCIQLWIDDMMECDFCKVCGLNQRALVTKGLDPFHQSGKEYVRMTPPGFPATGP